jgi:hypothetical protein
MSGQQEIRGTKNLGLVQAIYSGINPPLNTKIIWFDDNVGIKIHKYYDIVSATWIPFGNGVLTINGHYVYIAYASSCEGADFSLAYDDNIYTHTAIITSPTAIPINQLTPQLFASRGKWMKYCGEDLTGGNYTYIAYADDDQGNNFGLEPKYEVPCEPCEMIRHFNLVTNNSPSVDIALTPINNGVNIDFSVNPTQTIEIDLLHNNQPLQNSLDYFIEVQIPSTLNQGFYIRLDGNEYGGYYIIPNGQNQTFKFRKTNFGSRLYIEFSGSKKGVIKDTIFIAVGTATCPLDNEPKADKCYKSRTCFAIITSDDKFKDDELKPEMFDGKWFCLCCNDNNKNYDIENLKMLTYNLSGRQEDDSVELYKRISDLSKLQELLSNSVILKHKELSDRISTAESYFDNIVSVLTELIEEYLQTLLTQAGQIEGLIKQLEDDTFNPRVNELIRQYLSFSSQGAPGGPDGNFGSSPINTLLDTATLDLRWKNGAPGFDYKKPTDITAGVTDNQYVRNGFIADRELQILKNNPKKGESTVYYFDEKDVLFFPIRKINNLIINIDKETWSAIKGYRPFIQISRYKQSIYKGGQNNHLNYEPGEAGRLGGHHNEAGFKVDKTFRPHKPSRINIQSNYQVIDIGQEHYFKFRQFDNHKDIIDEVSSIGLKKRFSKVTHTNKYYNGAFMICKTSWVYLEFQIGILNSENEAVLSKPLNRLKMNLKIIDGRDGDDNAVQLENIINFKYV